MLTSQLNLSSNELCGVDWMGSGTYTAEGITAIADALKITASITLVDLKYNDLGEEGKAVLRKAVEGRSGCELLL